MCDAIGGSPKYSCHDHFSLQLLDDVEVYLEVFLACYLNLIIIYHYPE